MWCKVRYDVIFLDTSHCDVVSSHDVINQQDFSTKMLPKITFLYKILKTNHSLHQNNTSVLPTANFEANQGRQVQMMRAPLPHSYIGCLLLIAGIAFRKDTFQCGHCGLKMEDIELFLTHKKANCEGKEGSQMSKEIGLDSNDHQSSDESKV